ncbi:hypothetical protein [Streptomyces liliifuscus]|uniref:Uncharacterized protein n=1 Tax=Streptomyces liliifuscus TaxID=2797636 RepID=A0A7T7L2P8_9ACTN|nr:hypothetical protein [Streptomyces liliifuscus]QQM45236.1 hypothetical protein JEQ17_41395 [Streptomyces liliifuscus]
MDDEAILRFLAVDPATLKPAPPPRPRPPELWDRIGLNPVQCSACDNPAWTTRIITAPGLGFRWLDQCRDHAMAVIAARPKRPPVPLADTLAVLQRAAEEAGLRMRVIASSDMAGWLRE